DLEVAGDLLQERLGDLARIPLGRRLLDLVETTRHLVRRVHLPLGLYGPFPPPPEPLLPARPGRSRTRRATDPQTMTPAPERGACRGSRRPGDLENRPTRPRRPGSSPHDTCHVDR